MSAENELRTIEDVWFQMILILAVVSGAFTAADYGPLALRRFTSGRQPASSPAEPSPGPVAPGPGGMLVVDPAAAAGAAYKTVGAALAAARDGASILIKPGVYEESLSISVPGSIMLTGAGAKPGDVTLISDGPRTLSIGSGKVFLKGLTIANKATSDAAAIEVSRASLVLQQTDVAAARHGIRVADGELEISDGKIEAERAVTLQGKSRASLLRVTVSASAYGVLLEGMGDLRVESSELHATRGSAIEAGQFAKVRLTEVALTNCGGAAVTARSGAEVRIARSRITDNRGCGVNVDGASLLLEHVRFERDRCGVGFLGAGSLESVQSEYAKLELGPLAIKPGRERDVVVKGSGNIGLEIPSK